MRVLPPAMRALLDSGGPFIGEHRSGGFVTVEPTWTLSEVSSGIATPDPTKLPFRWYQRIDNSQTEVVIPGIKSIEWNRSTDTDVASCTIVIYNQTHDPALGADVASGQVGNPGYLSWGHGQPEAAARWGQVPNAWSNVLVPNALLRTYEGYPGDRTLAVALAAGLVVITGVWLIDEVGVGSDGMLHLSCRDMGKLLVEQQTYLPLMPGGAGYGLAWYPLSYYRWTYTKVSSPGYPVYESTAPIEYGPGAEGPKYVPDIVMSVDGQGYWLLGSDGAVFSFHVPFWGSRGDNRVPPAVVVGMTGSAGNGYWIVQPDGGVLSFGDAPFYGSAVGSLPSGGSITAMAANPAGTGYWLVSHTGAVYTYGSVAYHGGSGGDTAWRIESTASGAGYWMMDAAGNIYTHGDAAYHGGESTLSSPMVSVVRSAGGAGYWLANADGSVYSHGDAVFHGSASGGLTGTQVITAMATPPSRGGYWLVADDGSVFAYGSAAYYGGNPPANASIVAIFSTDSGAGYWLLAQDGAIYTFGDAAYLGGDDPPPSHIDTAPMTAMAADPLNRGYWLASADGGVFAFGDVGYYGSPSGTLGAGVVVAMTAHPDGQGYWLLIDDGRIFNYGSAGAYGAVIGGAAKVDIEATITGLGYWELLASGYVYATGDAVDYGNGVATGKTFVSMAIQQPAGTGYWLATADGYVYGYGTARAETPNGDWVAQQAALQDPIFAITGTPSGNGYLLAGGDGGVFSFGDAPFWGSLPGPFSYQVVGDGNMRDYTDIVEDLLRWSGFLAFGDGGDDVFGYLEQTGTYPQEKMLATVFDKRPVIDVINQIRDALGWLFFIYEDGSCYWGPPNWFTPGNLAFNGGRISSGPIIDELLLLTSYSATYRDKNIRSEVIVGSSDPDFALADTITTRQKIASPLLRGMIRPFMYVNEAIATKAEQQYMLEQIIDHIEFSLRSGTSSMWADPSIQINDQVRIHERQSAETYLHLVAGISSSHDFDSGAWTYQVTSSWFPPEWFATVGESIEGYTPILNPAQQAIDAALAAQQAALGGGIDPGPP